jgi:HEPN domain-containing protein
MTNDRLSKAYLEKAEIRIKALKFMHQEKGFSDVVRESQECVELLLKAVLRKLGMEVPKTHDVSHALREKANLLPKVLQDNLEEITSISRTLRKERELSFYGTEDWIPTEEYHEEDSLEAIKKTEKIYAWVSKSLI